MPIFHRHKLLFVHIPKNAGRSIETALLGCEGSPGSGMRSAWNTAASFISRETASSFAKEHLIGTLDVTLASQHLTYVEMEMLGLLPTGGFESFAIVRNPFDRAISSVTHFFGKESLQETQKDVRKSHFERHLFQWLDRVPDDHNQRAHRRSQIDFLRDRKGRLAVNKLLRFETLAGDFESFLSPRTELELSLPRVGYSGRTRDYRDYYNDASRERIEQEFKEDMHEFGYRF